MTSIESIFKDRAALLIYSMPYMFEATKNIKYWTPTGLHHWQPCATPILESYLLTMVGVLLWLATDDGTSLEPGTSSGDVAARVTELLADQKDAIVDLSLFDERFFSILESAYMAHLKPTLLSFGRQTSLNELDVTSRLAPVDEDDILEDKEEPYNLTILWDDAYGTYITDVCSQFESWSVSKVQQTANERTKRIISRLVPKVKFLQSINMLARTSLLPDVKSAPPLFSALFYTDLAESVAAVTDGIAVVSSNMSSANRWSTI